MRVCTCKLLCGGPCVGTGLGNDLCRARSMQKQTIVQTTIRQEIEGSIWGRLKKQHEYDFYLLTDFDPSPNNLWGIVWAGVYRDTEGEIFRLNAEGEGDTGSP